MEDGIELKEYSWTGMTGNVYHPVFKNDGWYLVPPVGVVGLDRIACLCNIPEDEVILLKLKYGG